MKSADSPVIAWAKSGAMELSGYPGGSPLVAPGDPANYVATQLATVAAAALERSVEKMNLPGISLLGERAAIAGLSRRGPYSCGGAFRTVPSADGWLGLSLARAEDFELVPALIESEVDFDVWSNIAHWTATKLNEEISERALMLGLPHSLWPQAEQEVREPVLKTRGSSRAQLNENPLVVDLTSLWAGPLATHLLQRTGCTVIKVEDTNRPDGARRGPSKFFDLLNAGKQSVAVDLSNRADVERLKRLIMKADLVVESSRPRALRQLGILAEDFVAAGTSWLSLTARGRASNAVGFGDDVAVAGGLAVEHGADLLPVGDALADPLSGVTAAAAASEALTNEYAYLIDISMIDVCKKAANGDSIPHETHLTRAGWQVITDEASALVAKPSSREVTEAAPPLGQDTDRWLR